VGFFASGSHGNPFSSFFQVAPPSVVLYRPEPGPLPLYPKTVLRRWYMAAISVPGESGSMAMSVAPVSSFTKSTLVQVFPPSVVL
jgi:hypothetical protein